MDTNKDYAPEEELNLTDIISQMTDEYSVKTEDDVANTDTVTTTVNDQTEDETFNTDNVEFIDDNEGETQKQFDQSTIDDIVSENTQEEGSADDDEELSPYAIAFNLIKEEGRLHIPQNINMEDLDEETLKKIFEEDEKIRNNQAFDFVKNRTDDPKLQELFEIVYNGGTYEDLESLREVMDIQMDFENADTKNESDQRVLIKEYLLEGLDQNNPAHKRKIDNVDKDIKDIFDNMENESIATEAKSYFLNVINNEKQKIKTAKENRLAEEAKVAKERELHQKKWNTDFINKLNSKDWSEPKKENVYNQFSTVQFSDGTEVELWQYKMNKIWENPELTHVFMDFLADFDEKELQFKSRDFSPTKQVAKKFVDNLKGKNKSKKGKTPSSRKTAARTPKFDPRDNI